jgi:hypothetical protein
LSAARWWAVTALLTVAVTAGLVVRDWRDNDTRPGFDAALAFVDTLTARASSAREPREISFGDALALAYLERQRLGLGSPFRLAEYALRDPRLDSATQRHVAAALFARAFEGRAYTIHPLALAAVGPADPTDSLASRARRGERHLRLIEQVLADHRDPRVGELVVRLAYSIAAAEGTIDRNAVAVVAPVAALVRDRRAAMSDARALLRAARARALDPLVILPSWRRERRFEVERPAAADMSEALEVAAMARVPSLLDAIRAIAQAADTARPSVTGTGTSPLLGPVSAKRLAAGVARYMPPQAAIVTAVRHHGAALLAAAGTVGGEVRRRLVESAVNEESFVAEVGRVSAWESSDVALARLVVVAGVALRPYAQEVPWFSGDPAPSEDELRREFGIAAVRFDAGVPARWQPYYRRLLGDGLRDLRRILPALTLDGARIRFRGTPLGGATLAMHDPASRTIHLPIATSAGAVAHEIAHDLDWQMGRQRYGRRGSYGTDVVVREQNGRLAASLRGLTSARLIPPAGASGARPPDEVRPAEVFARTLDWFVAIALAREGRVNGYLSAVQDEVLSGHVAVLPRDVGGWSAEALAGVLEEMTLVGAPLREWLLAHWGAGRVRRPYALAREIIAAPRARRLEVWFRPEATPDVWTPRCSPSPYDSPSTARAGLAALAAEARARGALRSRAERFKDSDRPAWAESILGRGPWSPRLGEEAVRRAAAMILVRVEKSGETGSAFAWSDAVGDPGGVAAGGRDGACRGL